MGKEDELGKYSQIEVNSKCWSSFFKEQELFAKLSSSFDEFGPDMADSGFSKAAPGNNIMSCKTLKVSP